MVIVQTRRFCLERIHTYIANENRFILFGLVVKVDFLVHWNFVLDITSTVTVKLCEFILLLEQDLI